MAAFTGQTHRQFAGQRINGLAQRHHLLTRGMHEVDIFGQRFSQRAGHGLGTTIGHQPAPDLRLYFLAHLRDPTLELVTLEAFLETRELSPGLLLG